MFFAQKLYKLNILTIGDYYRERYGRGVEVLCTLFIVLSYLGWVGAQVAALGLVINLITEGYISVSGGMVIGTAVGALACLAVNIIQKKYIKKTNTKGE